MTPNRISIRLENLQSVKEAICKRVIRLLLVQTGKRIFGILSIKFISCICIYMDKFAPNMVTIYVADA